MGLCLTHRIVKGGAWTSVQGGVRWVLNGPLHRYYPWSSPWHQPQPTSWVLTGWEIPVQGRGRVFPTRSLSGVRENDQPALPDLASWVCSWLAPPLPGPGALASCCGGRPLTSALRHAASGAAVQVWAGGWKADEGGTWGRLDRGAPGRGPEPGALGPALRLTWCRAAAALGGYGARGRAAPGWSPWSICWENGD